MSHDIFFRSIGEIHEGKEFTGFRVYLTANYSFKLLLENRNNAEAVLTEKSEIVISRNS